MANDVDKQVVAVEFDNSKFDKNVKKSSSTLDEFKSKLRFEDASKSLEAVAKKLNKLDAVTFTVINNITNRVINLGVQLVKSLSVNNIAAGWDKFGNKTVATATIMAQSVKITGKELTDYAEKTEAVNEQLEKLLWFTDETSYNFTDMVESIGKFTAAGVDLDVAAEAMQGIATWAAKSGQNAMTASRAMYQLAQTLGKGYVQLMDWRSIQNANMDTEEFRKTVLETAEAIGELRKQGNEYITKTGKKITAKNFTDTLSEKWFTSDVLTKTLKKYSAAVDEIYKIAEDSGKTAYEIIQEFGDELDPFGVAAFKAAQECRTLGDALNSIKDAVSTGFMTTFETIVGQYDEAKEIWSDLADSLYDAFVESGNFRNSILKTWRALEGNQDVFGSHGDTNQGAFWNIYDAIHELRSIASDAWRSVFPKSIFSDESDQAQDLARQLKDTTSRIKEFTKNIKETIKNDTALQGILKGIAGIAKVILATGQGIYAALQPVINVVKDVLLDLFDRFGVFGDRLSNNEKVIEVISSVAEKVAGSLSKIMDFLDLKGNIGKFLDFIASIFNGTFDANSFADGVANFFIKMKDGFVSLMDALRNTKGIGDVLNAIIDAFKNFFSKIKSLFSSNDVATEMAVSFGGGSSGGVGMAKRMMAPVKVMKEVGEVVKDSVDTTEWFMPLLESLKTLGKSLSTLLSSIIKVLASLFNAVASLIDYIASINFDKILNWVKDNWLAASAILVAAYFTLTQLVPLIYDLFYMTRGFSIALNTLADGVWKFGQGINKKGIASIINAFGLLILEMSLSISLLTPIIQTSSEAFKEATIRFGELVGILAGALSVIFIISTFMSKITDSVKLTLKKNEGLNISGRRNPLSEMSYVITSFGLAMIEIAVAMSIIGKLDYASFDKAKEILKIVGTIGIIVSAIGLLMSLIGGITKTSNTINQIYPGLLSLIGFALVIKTFGKTLSELSGIMEKSNDIWAAVGAMSALLGAFGILAITIGGAGRLAGNTNNISKTTKSVSIIMLSMMPLFFAIKSICKNDSGVNVDLMMKAVGIIAILPTILSGMMVLLSLVSGLTKLSENSISKAVSSLAILMTSMLPFVYSVILLAKALGDKTIAAYINTALMTLGIVLGSEILLIGILNMLSKSNSSGLAKSLTSLIAVNFALLPFVLSTLIVCEMIREYGGTNVAMSIGLLIGVISAYSLLTLALSKMSGESGGIVKIIFGLLLSAIALGALITAVMLFQNIPMDKLIASMAGISVVLVSLSALMGGIAKLNEKAKDVKTLLSIALILGIVMGTLTAMVAVTANSSLGTIIALFAGLSLVMMLVTKLIKTMSNITKSFNYKETIESFIGIISGLSIMAIAFGTAFAIMKGVDWSTILAAGVSMFTVMLGFAGALAIFNAANIKPSTLIEFGIGLVAIAGGLTALLTVLNLMTGENLLQIGLGFLALCGGLTLLAVIAKFIQPSVMALMGLGLSMGVIAVALYVTSAALNVFIAALTPLGESVGVIGDLIITSLTAICEFFINSSDLILNTVVTLISILVEAIVESAGTIMEGIVALVTKIAENFAALKDPIISIINNVFDILDAFLPRLFKTLTKLIDGVIQFLRTETPKFVKWLSETITVVLTEVRDNIRNWAEMFFDIVWGIMSTFAKKLLTKIPDVVNYLFDFVRTVLDSLGDALVKRGKEMGVTFIKFGKNLMKGLWNGMMGGLGELVKGIPLIGGALESFFKETLQIHSPSRMTAEMGVYLMQGFGVGMQEEMRDTKKDTTNILASCMTQAMNDAYDIINSEDDGLVIRPIVDLSGVQTGAHSISSMMSSISGGSISVSSNLANSAVKGTAHKTSDDKENQNGSVVNNEGDTYNVTYNVTTNDPEELAKQTDAALQRERMKAAYAKGGAY